MSTPEAEVAVLDIKAPLAAAGTPREGKSSLAMITEAQRLIATEITTTDQAIAAVEATLRALAPWPETVTVHDRARFESRLMGDREQGYALPRADISKLRAIRVAVRSTLGPVMLVRLPDLLLVMSERAVTSVWDDAVRQVAG